MWRRVRWQSAGRLGAAVLACLLAVKLAPALLRAPEPPPLEPDIGLPHPATPATPSRGPPRLRQERARRVREPPRRRRPEPRSGRARRPPKRPERQRPQRKGSYPGPRRGQARTTDPTPAPPAPVAPPPVAPPPQPRAEFGL